jgi:hypothetical protein
VCRKVRRPSPASWAGGQSGSDFAIGSAPRTEAFLRASQYTVGEFAGFDASPAEVCGIAVSPKSSTFTMPEGVTLMLAGLRSR